MKLIGEFISGPAGSGSQGAPALNHEIRNHAMKREAVVKRTLGFLVGFRIGKLLGTFGQADKIRDGLRRLFFKQAADDVSLRSLKDGIRSRRSCQNPLPA